MSSGEQTSGDVERWTRRGSMAVAGLGLVSVVACGGSSENPEPVIAASSAVAEPSPARSSYPTYAPTTEGVVVTETIVKPGDPINVCEGVLVQAENKTRAHAVIVNPIVADLPADPTKASQLKVLSIANLNSRNGQAVLQSVGLLPKQEVTWLPPKPHCKKHTLRGVVKFSFGAAGKEHTAAALTFSKQTAGRKIIQHPLSPGAAKSFGLAGLDIGEGTPLAALENIELNYKEGKRG